MIFSLKISFPQNPYREAIYHEFFVAPDWPAGKTKLRFSKIKSEPIKLTPGGGQAQFRGTWRKRFRSEKNPHLKSVNKKIIFCEK
jgi:hypothetical protein